VPVPEAALAPADKAVPPGSGGNDDDGDGEGDGDLDSSGTFETGEQFYYQTDHLGSVRALSRLGQSPQTRTIKIIPQSNRCTHDEPPMLFATVIQSFAPLGIPHVSLKPR